MSLLLNWEVTVTVDKSALISAAVRNGIKEALLKTAHNIEAEMKDSIEHGEKTGRVYRKESQVSFKAKGKAVSFTAHKGSKTEHQASAPGEAPAADFGDLVNSIGVIQDNLDNLEVEVIAKAEYAMNLEVGTAHMEPRPFMVPAVRKNDEPFRETVKAIVKSEIGG